MFKNLRRKLHSNMMFIGILVIVAGFIASAIITNFNEKAIETTAVIIDITEPDGTGVNDLKGTVVNIQYIVDGKTYTDELGYYEDGMEAGQTVQVRYDPENPESIRPADGPDVAKKICIIGGLIFLAGMALNIWMSINERRRADKRAEKRYERKNGR